MQAGSRVSEKLKLGGSSGQGGTQLAIGLESPLVGYRKKGVEKNLPKANLFQQIDFSP